MGKLLHFTGETLVPIPPDQVLEGAKGKLDYVVVLGWTASGEVYVASSTSKLPDALWLIEQAKLELLDGDLVCKDDAS